MNTFLLTRRKIGVIARVAMILCLAAGSVLGGLLPGNIWPNPTLELDSNGDGVPNFWHRGGTDTSIDVWTTVLSVSSTHAFLLNDTGASSYGEWYSDQIAIQGATNYLLRYNLRYSVTNVGPMRVTINFYDAAGTYVSGLSFLFAGAHDFWEEMTQAFTAPAVAAKLNFSFTSGGSLEVTGQAWLDDLSLAPAPKVVSLVPYLEGFPPLPDPLVSRNWKQTATDYHQLAFNPSATGPSLPLLHEYTAHTAAGFAGPAFSLPSYVGNPVDSGEALTVLGAVLGGTLAGMNLSNLNGKDRVQQCEVFYSVINGHGLVLNNVDSRGSGSAWYDIFPSTLFYQIGSRYPGRASYQLKMRSIADSWLAALPVLSNNWDHAGFDFQTMTPVNGAWTEPDMAIGIAWLEYMAYVQFQDARQLAAADTCLAQMELRTTNPFYETLAFYGPPLAARLNAELGRHYSTARYLNWIFGASSDARPGWGCESGRWGNYDAYGLIGSTTDSSGYAFSMNSFTAAGVIAPVARYEPQYARLLGRWLLHVAANASLFYPDTLPTGMQSSAAWVQQTGVRSISYEGVRHLGATTPYATGDAVAPIQDVNPYGAWGSGWMAALFQTSNVPGILQIDCLASESFAPPAFPTFLYYNPYAIARSVAVDVGVERAQLYDAVTGLFLATNVTGKASFNLPPDTAVVLVQSPAAAAFSQTGGRLLAGGRVIDYWNATRDTDADGLPDWWESRYFGNATNAMATATAANGLRNRDCYQLGLDPTDPLATFALLASHSVGGLPQVTWNTVGGKTYVLEFANRLSSSAGFAPALSVTETKVAAGVGSNQTFVDDGSLTGGPPGASGRYYRVRLAPN